MLKHLALLFHYPEDELDEGVEVLVDPEHLVVFDPPHMLLQVSDGGLEDGTPAFELSEFLDVLAVDICQENVHFSF